MQTPIVYVDPKVQLPLPKQNMAKHPKSHKTDQTDIIAIFSKQPNISQDILPFPWWIGNRMVKEGTPMLKGNASRSKSR